MMVLPCSASFHCTQGVADSFDVCPSAFRGSFPLRTVTQRLLNIQHAAQGLSATGPPSFTASTPVSSLAGSLPSPAAVSPAEQPQSPTAAAGVLLLLVQPPTGH